MRRIPIGPAISAAVILVVTLFGGQFTAVEARGRVVNDWTGEPLQADLHFGKRVVTADENGYFDLGPVPPGSRLSAIKTAFGRVDFTAGDGEVRMAPATLTLEVKDAATGRGVPNPEVRLGDKVIGRGTESGSVAVVHPGKDQRLLVCAPNYQSLSRVYNVTFVEMTLQPDGPGCPPLPSPSPSPRTSPGP